MLCDVTVRALHSNGPFTDKENSARILLVACVLRALSSNGSTRHNTFRCNQGYKNNTTAALNDFRIGVCFSCYLGSRFGPQVQAFISFCQCPDVRNAVCGLVTELWRPPQTESSQSLHQSSEMPKPRCELPELFRRLTSCSRTEKFDHCSHVRTLPPQKFLGPVLMRRIRNLNLPTNYPAPADWPLFQFLNLYTVGRTSWTGISPSQGLYLYKE
jgi:hypothetical protein